MILVLVETDASGAVEVSRETITFARKLSDAGGVVPIDAVVVGDVVGGVEPLLAQLAAYGVREVHHTTGPAFDAYGGAAWASAVQSVRDAKGSVVITAAGTPRGMEVLAHLAARTGVIRGMICGIVAGVLVFLYARLFRRGPVDGAIGVESSCPRSPAKCTITKKNWSAATCSRPGACSPA